MYASILEAGTETKEAVPRPWPEAFVRRVPRESARLFNGLTPELQTTLAVIAGMSAGIALWLFLGTSLLGDNVAAQFVSLFIFVSAGAFAGAVAVTMRRRFGEDDGSA